LCIVSIADPEHPENISSFVTPGSAFGVAVTDDYAFIASTRVWEDGEYIDGGLRIISIADPGQPYELGFYDSPGRAWGVDVSGDYAFIADRDGGLRVVSITDPENPEEVSSYAIAEAFDVTVYGEYAYVCCRGNGMRVISISDPENPEEIGYYNTMGTAIFATIDDDGLIYLADGSSVGIYRFTDPAGVYGPASSIPVKFTLSPAYPNPFNSTTTIEYALPYASQVSLNIYNLSGQRIETLFNSRLQAGFHRSTLNAGDLPSGLYFVKLEGEGQLFTRKIMLIR